jgi:hypothetical protein
MIIQREKTRGKSGDIYGGICLLCKTIQGLDGKFAQRYKKFCKVAVLLDK